MNINLDFLPIGNRKGIIMQTLFGAITGIIIDIIVAAIYSMFAEQWETWIGATRSPIPWYYYKYPPSEYEWASTLAWDDVIMLALTILSGIGLWIFKKQPLWFTLGFLIGWNISSNEDFLSMITGA